MPSKPFAFQNAVGETLSGRLDLPAGDVCGYAIFAHCFTCSKTTLATARIAQALAAHGIGVLRFDFTGLGDSGGEFARGGFSGDVNDIVAAAMAMEAADRPVSLLVGHSFGGAAVLAAAGNLPGVKAVATIAAPAEPSHVAHQFNASVTDIETAGQAEVTLAGRTFTLTKGFLDDIRGHDLAARIHGLRRPLLILHAPTDETVGIENASRIFEAALHPKSFISLDRADHLLTDRADAVYAADVIAAWASRYLATSSAEAEKPPHEWASATPNGDGKFQLRIETAGLHWQADEPETLGGLGTGASPYDMLSAALAACTAMTLRLYADHKGLPAPVSKVTVQHEKHGHEDVFVREIGLVDEIEPDIRTRLLEIADRCPVHKTLTAASTIETYELKS